MHKEILENFIRVLNNPVFGRKLKFSYYENKEKITLEVDLEIVVFKEEYRFSLTSSTIEIEKQLLYKRVYEKIIEYLYAKYEVKYR